MSVNDRIQLISDSLARDSFCCSKDLDLGFATAALYAQIRVRWYFVMPFIRRYYFFPNPTGQRCPTVRQLCALHSMARDFTDRQNRIGRFWRMTVNITATIILIDAPAEPATVEYVQTKKERYQFGDANLIVLCSQQDHRVYSLAEFGNVNAIPLSRTSRYIHTLCGSALRQHRVRISDRAKTQREKHKGDILLFLEEKRCQGEKDKRCQE